MLIYSSLWVIVLLAQACSPVKQAAQVDVSYLSADPILNPTIDSAVYLAMEPYRLQVAEAMDAVIGHAGEDIAIGIPDNPLGNWMADAIYHDMTRRGFAVDFVIVNRGGIRIPVIPEGEVTRGRMYELMPFGNMLVIMDMSKKDVEKLLTHTLDWNGWPVSEGLSYRLSENGVEKITLHGAPLHPEKTYKVMVSDYIAMGGDRSIFLTEIPHVGTGILMRDAMISYVELLHKEGGKLTSPLEKRVEIW